MPSSDLVPWPVEWTKTKTSKCYLGLIWIGLLALGSFVTAVAVVGGGSDKAAKYLFAFSLLFATIVVVGFDSRVRLRKGGARTISPAVDLQGIPATKIRYSWIAFAGSNLLMALLVAVFAAASYDFATADASSGVTVPLAAAIIFGAVGLLFASYFVQIVSGKIARGHLLLTPHGLQHRSWGYEARLSWSGVLHVSALNGDGPEVWIRGTSTDLVQHRTAILWSAKPPRSSGIELQGKSLGSDPALVYHMVHYYLANPDARAELGTESATGRAREGNYF